MHLIRQLISSLMIKYQPVEVKNYLNRYLPRDIAVNRVELVDERFHSQLNAREKTYVYKIDMANVANVFTRSMLIIHLIFRILRL